MDCNGSIMLSVRVNERDREGVNQVKAVVRLERQARGGPRMKQRTSQEDDTRVRNSSTMDRTFFDSFVHRD